MTDIMIQEKFLEALEQSSDPIFAIDGKQMIHLWTTGMEKLTGLSPAEANNDFCYNALRGTDNFGNPYCCEGCPIVRMLERNEPIYPFELQIQNRKDSTWHRVRCSHVLMVDHRKEPPICVYMLQDLGEVSAQRTIPIVSRPELAATAPDESPRTLLSKREMQVLKCLAQGMTSSGIAQAMSISESTVRNHIQNVLQKFGVHRRVEALAKAYQERLV